MNVGGSSPSSPTKLSTSQSTGCEVFLTLFFELKYSQKCSKIPIFDTRLRNFTERILTFTFCKILLPHASIHTIKRKLRNFTEFFQSCPFTCQATYGSYGEQQLLFIFTRRLCLQKTAYRKNSTNFIYLPSAST